MGPKGGEPGTSEALIETPELVSFRELVSHFGTRPMHSGRHNIHIVQQVISLVRVQNIMRIAVQGEIDTA
jgi:hypothetical protein